MKICFHHMFILFYIGEISCKSQFIKIITCNKQHKTTCIRTTWIKLRAQCHFVKVNIKMFVIWNDVLFDIDIIDLILICFDDLKNC